MGLFKKELGASTPNAEQILTDLTRHLLIEEEKKRIKREEERAAFNEKYENKRIEIWDKVLSHCRPATIDDYLAWLKGRVTTHGTDKITYVDFGLLDQPKVMQGGLSNGIWDLQEDVEERIMADRRVMWVLEKPLPKNAIPVAHGSLAFKIIVPAEHELSLQDVQDPNRRNKFGHSEFYFMNGFDTNANGILLYKDVAQRFQPGSPTLRS